MNFPLFPPSASTTARQVDFLYLALTGISAVCMVVIFGAIAYFLFKYRRGKPANRAPLRLPTLKIEIFWTVIPTLMLMGIFTWAAGVYYHMAVPPEDAMEIQVIGKQWMWKIQHPEGNREINELHVPVGRNIKLLMASEDVIHSFFLPAFRTKQDVLPGRYSTQWFQATKVGIYHIFCAEYCGTSHSQMIGHVIVMPPEEYEAWLERGRPGSTLAQAGESLFRELGCSGCHMGNSQIHAPPLEGLFGKQVPISDGSFVRANEQYIRDSILLPQSQIAAGYQPLMPSYQNRVTEEQVLDLVEYIRYLGRFQPKEGYETR